MAFAMKKNQTYTYRDYLTWDDNEQWELINGIPFMVSPSPSTRHQEISINILFELQSYLKDKPCKVFHAPFDVRLSLGESDADSKNVVQPDIVVVCDKNKLDEKGCKGAPDIIVEIISTSTVKKDLHDKFSLYERAGVPEYWVVFPSEKEVQIFKLHDNKYDEGARFLNDDVILIEKFANFKLFVRDIFKES